MHKNEVRELFERFCQPMTEGISEDEGDFPVLRNIARRLWLSAILDPDDEEQVWEHFRTVHGWSEEEVATLQTLYQEFMRPELNDEQILMLQQRYCS